MDYDDIPREPSPEVKANPISRLFFIWLVPLLRKGEKKDLEVGDVYSSLPEDASEKLGDFFERKWKEEVRISQKKSRPPKLWRVVVKFIWKRYTVIGIVNTLDELILRVFQPIILKSFIKTFSSKSDEDDNFRRNQFLLAGGLVLCTLLHAITYQKVITTCLHIGMRVRVGVSSLIFRKMLHLRVADSEETNVGKLCNLLSSDVGRFDQGFQFFHSFYIAPIQVGIYAYLLWSELGPSSMGGIGCILFLLPIQVLVGRFSFYFRTRIARRSDKRARFLNEIIRGIRLIKMYAWEKPFCAVVSKLRSAEIKFVRRGLYLRGMYLCVHAFSQKFIPFCALIVYVAFGNELEADKAFFTISIFAVMQAVLNRIPQGAALIGEMMASMNRIEAFLMSKERTPKFLIDDAETEEMKPSVVMENYSASWSEDEDNFTLKNLNVNVTGNKLVMVIGHVGCGKTSFLNAILSELPHTSSGACLVNGRLTYASQEAWIFPATLRQNILFGLEMDSERYWKTIEMCCLTDDLSQFPDGDMTLVGERGVALSGGQKARVNLARALYQQADIYLLDDPLSAVDIRVNRFLFQKCIREYLEGKLRILVTHQLQYLPMADHIIVLNREGEIWCQGTYAELKRSDVDFSSLITDQFVKQRYESMGQSENEDEDEVEEEKKDTDPGPIPVNRTSAKEEKKESGSVGIRVYFEYFRSGGSYFVMTILFLAILGSHGVVIVVDYWLSLWTNSVSGSENNEDSQDVYAYVYSGLIGGFLILMIIRSILFFGYCMRISINLHDRMFSSVVRAPVKFFDDNPSGRIMNRFTRDLNHVDESLPLAFNDFISVMLSMIGMLIINAIANYYTVIPSALLLFCLWRIRQFYLGSARDLKRLDSLTKSPMFTHVTMTIQGLTTIRALRAENRVLQKFENIQNTHTSVFYILLVANRWFGVTLEMMTSCYLTLVTFGFLILSSTSESGSVGVALSSILSMAGALQWGLRQSAETENYMTSVERAFEYCKLTPEAPLQMPGDDKIPPNWPEHGRVHFQDVSLAYDDLQERTVLKEVNFSTEPEEKVGIVGRTGAGKSSLITALFRLTEPCQGEIVIDEVPIKDIGLHTLRSKISIIPQDPVLFTGTLRYNLDPFNEFEDPELWRVLKEVDLHHAIQNLDCPVSDGGSNFSTGQRQLVCLARAALRNNKILVMDEATANVDPATDQLVQQTIKSKFTDCTILTIAHRLRSVLDSDRILVMDNGRVVEFDKPDNLSNNEKCVFYNMLHQTS